MYELRGDIRMAMDDYLTTTRLNPKIHEAWFQHGMNYFNNKLKINNEFYLKIESKNKNFKINFFQEIGIMRL